MLCLDIDYETKTLKELSIYRRLVIHKSQDTINISTKKKIQLTKLEHSYQEWQML